MIREERNALAILLLFTAAAALLYGFVLRPALQRATRRAAPVEEAPGTLPPSRGEEAKGPQRPKAARRFFSVRLLPLDGAVRRPLQGAAVELLGAEDLVEPETSLEPGGALRVDFLPPRVTFSLRISAEGYRPLLLPHLRGGAGHVRDLGAVALSPLRRLDVEVTLPAGAAEGDAAVRVLATDPNLPSHPPDAPRIVADAVLSGRVLSEGRTTRGRVRFADLPAALVVVAARAGADVVPHARVVDLRPGDAVVRLTLHRGTEAVLRTAPPSPQNARRRILLVAARPAPLLGRDFLLAELHEDAPARVATAPCGDALLAVDGEGAARRLFGPLPPPLGGEEVLSPPPGCALRVRVVSEGVPARAEVAVLAEAEGALPLRARCDEDGVCRFTTVPGGRVRVAAFLGEGRGLAWTEVTPAAPADVEIEVQPTTRLEGSVRRGETPLAAAEIRFPDVGRRVFSGADGSFHLGGLPPGPLRFFAVGPEGAATEGTAHVRLGEGAKLDVVLPAPLGLDVIVRDPHAKPRAAPAWVYRYDLDLGDAAPRLGFCGRTDDAGRLRVPLPAAADHRFLLLAAPEPGEPGRAPVRSPPLAADADLLAAGVALTFLAPAALEGRWTDAPEVRSVVRLAPPPGDPADDLVWDLTRRSAPLAADGSFRFEAVPPGPVLVRRLSARGIAGPVEPLVLDPGERRAALPRDEATRDWIDGVVVDGSNAPLAGLRVEMAAAPAAAGALFRIRTRTTDGRGRFRLLPPAAPARLRVFRGATLLAERELDAAVSGGGPLVVTVDGG